MTQPPSQPWDPNADSPGYGYPPQQPPPGYGNQPPPPPPGYGNQPPGYSTPPSQPGYGNPPPPTGYGPPPGQPGYPPGQPGYPPGQPGYPPPGPGVPPPGYASSEDKTYALVAHFGGAIGTLISGGVLSFVGPLIALVARGNQSPTVKAHAKNALNFFIPVAGAGLLLFVARVCNGIISPLGLWFLFSSLLWLLHAAVWICGIVFGIIGGMRANEGQLYKYPISFPIIK